MKKLLTILFSVFIYSCNLFIDPIGEKLEYLNEKPKSVFIGESNDGAIVFENRIQKISNLNISNEITYLNTLMYDKKILNEDEIKNIGIFGKSSYYIDKNNNGIFVYSPNDENYCSSIFYNDIDYINDLRVDFSTKNLSDCKNFLFRIKDNNIIKNQEAHYFLEDYINEDSLTIIDNNSNYYLYYLRNEESISKQNIILKSIGNSEIKDYLIDLGESRSNLLDLNIDDKGNGWYFYEDIDYFKYFSINNFQKKNELSKNEVDANTDTLKTRYKKNYLDLNGNGFILNIKNNLTSKNREVYIQKIANFKMVNKKNLLIRTQDLAYIEKSSQDKYFFSINNEGNGVMFFYKTNKIETFDYIYMKKIRNFNLDFLETQISNSNKYNYYDFSINKNGNGVLILERNGNGVLNLERNKTFIIKKIRNYEIEK